MFQVYDATYGRCYTMRVTDLVTNLGIINLVLKSHMGVHVYLHHPGQYMDVDSKTKIYGTLGNMLFIDLTHELTINTLEGDGEIPCNSTVDFSYDQCINEKIAEHMIQEFGCLAPFLPPTDKTR